MGQVPGQHHLRGGGAMSGGDAGDHGVVEEVGLALAERSPGLREDAVPGVRLAQLSLLEVGVQLDLVDDGHLAGGRDDLLELGEREVGHADGADQATAAQLDQRLPGLDVQALLGDRPVDQVQIQVVQAQTLEGGLAGGDRVLAAVVVDPQLGGHEYLLAMEPGITDPASAALLGDRPVDQVQIQVVQAQTLEGGLAGGDRVLEAVVVVPQLGGHEHLLAWEPGLTDRASDALLVGVQLGGVDVTVTGCERLAGDVGCDVGVDLEDPVPELGDRMAVVEGQVRTGGHGLLLEKCVVVTTLRWGHELGLPRTAPVNPARAARLAPFQRPIPEHPPVYDHERGHNPADRPFEVYGLLDTLFIVAGVVVSVWLALLYLVEGFSLTPVRLLYLVGFWLLLTYITLPRLHQLMTWIYLPDYFFGRTRTTEGVLSDPINLAFDGPEKDVHVAMRRAGWVLAEERTLASAWGMVRATVLRRSYPAAPVSDLRSLGRTADFACPQI